MVIHKSPNICSFVLWFLLKHVPFFAALLGFNYFARRETSSSIVRSRIVVTGSHSAVNTARNLSRHRRCEAQQYLTACICDWQHWQQRALARMTSGANIMNCSVHSAFTTFSTGVKQCCLKPAIYITITIYSTLQLVPHREHSSFPQQRSTICCCYWTHHFEIQN